ncbi:MAG TPA: hypothetical protein VFK13_07835 [Gemmatimonadaceae bacterium]|nr:hypothetical protein [Gemmatimonadaceae bacterium]
MTESTTIIARLYEHIEPLDRGTRYEDPLDAALRAAHLGEVTGGGSQLGELGEIEYADIEMQTTNLDEALPLIVRSLEASGAPAGSQLLGPAGVIREFGQLQSVAVYLDGVSLPDEVYAALDFSGLVTRLGSAAGPDSFHSFSQGPEETGLFFFATDAEVAFQQIESVLRPLPIGQNARIVIRPSRERESHRTVRLPRH